jgi:SAM-dependent methyltransferase
MNENEIKYLKDDDLSLYDATSLPIAFLLKSLFIKFRRKTYGKLLDRNARMVWTTSQVSDAVGPADNVRNYLERQTLRAILKDLSAKYPIHSACEVGCGYGRIIMVLKEFAGRAVGFEREGYLVNIAEQLLPAIEFRQVGSLDQVAKVGAGSFDFAMTCTVLQHLTDDFCKKVLQEMKALASGGHILLIEKTYPINITENTKDGDSFLSRDRPVRQYEDWMKPFVLASTRERIVEPKYYNAKPGTCMLFRSPKLKQP